MVSDGKVPPFRRIESLEFESTITRVLEADLGLFADGDRVLAVNTAARGAGGGAPPHWRDRRPVRDKPGTTRRLPMGAAEPMVHDAEVAGHAVADDLPPRRVEHVDADTVHPGTRCLPGRVLNSLPFNPPLRVN